MRPIVQDLFHKVAIPLFALCLSAACGRISSNCTVSPSGLTSWWSGGSTSGLTAADAGGGNNPGTLGSAIKLVSGRNSTAFYFDGASSISIPASSTLNLNQFTISTWFKSDSQLSQPTSQTLFSKWAFQDSNLTNASNWSGALLGTAGGLLGTNYGGFLGNTFDGRYVYYMPSAHPGYLAVYDTKSGYDFTHALSWTGINLGSLLGANYSMQAIHSVFDGRYLYLVPIQVGNYAARLDRLSGYPITDSRSWTGLNLLNIFPSYAGNGGGVFDGRYIYFAPRSGVTGYTAIRFDTKSGSDFTSALSWTSVDIHSSDILGANYAGYHGASFDGRYVYFLPTNTEGYIARYDTFSTAGFSASSSWSGVKTSDLLGANYTSFSSAVFDGRYLYLPSSANAGYFAVLDTRSGYDFTSARSWTGFYLASTSLLGSNYAQNYVGGAFDGRYAYFVPRTGASTYVPRLDTQSGYTFNDARSWTGVSIGTGGLLGANYVGFIGLVFDGRYLYFGPRDFSGVTRYDTTGTSATYSLKTSYLIGGDGSHSSILGPLFLLNSDLGSYFISNFSIPTQDQWHHLAGTYNGTTASLYQDGALLTSQSTTAYTGSGALSIGSLTGGSEYFAGAMDDIQIYNRALSGSEIQSLYSNKLCK